MPAELVALQVGAEGVLRQGVVARKQPQPLRRDHRAPPAHLGADRAVAANGAVRQVHVRLEAHRAAVATAQMAGHRTALPSLSSTVTSPQPSARTFGSILRRSPTMTQTRRSGWMNLPAAAASCGSVSARRVDA